MAENHEAFTTPDIAHVREAMRKHDEDAQEDTAHHGEGREDATPERPASTTDRPD